ncbi:plancitoxin-1-like protein, partial [Leptotrombidium deliense]
TSNEANNILLHLQTLRPNIYYSNDAKLLKDNSGFKNLVDKVAPKESSAQRTIKSYKGQVFIAFSKNPKASGDLYGAYIAPSLKNDLSVETWRRGAGGPLTSNCSSTYKIINVDTLEMKFKGGNIFTTDEWLYTQDHAKWAVTTASISPFVCIADINRMESQFKRGGGSLCFNDSDVWKQFNDIIKGVEACPK